MKNTVERRNKKLICYANVQNLISSFHGSFFRFILIKLDFEMQKVEKLKSLCLQYAAATQWLISSSIDIPKLDELSDGSVGNSKSPSRALKLTTRNPSVADSIL